MTELIETALHEAGHAVPAVQFGHPIKRVVLKPGDYGGGFVEYELRASLATRTPADIRNDMIVAFAGPLAEARLSGKEELFREDMNSDRTRYFQLATCLSGTFEQMDAEIEAAKVSADENHAHRAGKTGSPRVNCHLMILSVSLARQKIFGRLAQWYRSYHPPLNSPDLRCG